MKNIYSKTKIFFQKRLVYISAIILFLTFLTWNNRFNKIDTSLEEKLKEKVEVIEEKQEKISELNSEIERHKMIASDWYLMWREERVISEWLWDFYYSNVCDIEKAEEYCKSGVFE